MPKADLNVRKEGRFYPLRCLLQHRVRDAIEHFLPTCQLVSNFLADESLNVEVEGLEPSLYKSWGPFLGQPPNYSIFDQETFEFS